MSYIHELRSLVGTRPLLLPGSCVIVQDDQDRILLIQRGESGRWCLPSGFTEPGETAEETARRETWEETGLTLGALTTVGVVSGPEVFHTYPNGDQVHNFTAVYATREFSGELRPDGHESLQVGWFALDALPSPLTVSTVLCLACLHKT